MKVLDSQRVDNSTAPRLARSLVCVMSSRITVICSVVSSSDLIHIDNSLRRLPASHSALSTSTTPLSIPSL